uniref:E3 ubiquitin-protein ligase UBR5 ubiquitin-associated domain-containing protein n=1 Tax=Meloidogyne enterolobii TaxID=390850 RepID=A0A6V7Y922_MELEN|nr:unnamed protein product [Meloidogyne enterolobii]
MMTRPGTRSGGFCRTGVVIDRNRSRPMIPASSVPEDLIVQCQVVLQGKSRDVIVRELQRTNLNVNEAVNNLLSRDDDEMDDLDDTSEAYLHEELLSLLDAGLRSDGSGAAAAALLDSDSIYSAGDGYEYLISRDLARRKGKGWGEVIMDENVWGRSNNNTVFGSGTSATQRPNDPRSTVLRSTTANSTTPSISANDSVTLGGSGATSLPLAAQSVVTADNTVVANLGDNSDFSTSNTSTQLSACFSTVVKLIDELLLQLFFMKIGNNKAISQKESPIYLSWIQRFLAFFRMLLTNV